MNQIRNNLYIGDQNDPKHPGILASAGVTAILNVAKDLNDDYAIVGMFYMKVGLIDGPGNTPPMIRMALQALDSLLTEGHTVLIHCIAGHSRAPYISARCLAARENCGYPLTFSQICAARPGVEMPNRLAGLYGTGY